MPYSYLDDIATADIAFRAWGRTPEELFIAAADATMNVMADDLDAIASVQQREVSLTNDSLDLLLLNFLQELVYYKDAEKLLLRVKKVFLKIRKKEFSVKAQLSGEPLNSEKHKLKVDIKAITLHRLKVGQTPSGWEATVVVDI